MRISEKRLRRVLWNPMNTHTACYFKESELSTLCSSRLCLWSTHRHTVCSQAASGTGYACDPVHVDRLCACFRGGKVDWEVGHGAPNRADPLARLVHLAYSAAYMIPLPAFFHGLDPIIQRCVAHRSLRLS